MILTFEVNCPFIYSGSFPLTMSKTTRIHNSALCLSDGKLTKTDGGDQCYCYWYRQISPGSTNWYNCLLLLSGVDQISHFLQKIQLASLLHKKCIYEKNTTHNNICLLVEWEYTHVRQNSEEFLCSFTN